MSEQDPLIRPTNADVEAHNDERRQDRSFRERTANALESSWTHKLVITLIIIDAACVLADLSYILLSPGCTPPGPDGPVWLDVLSYISIAITSVFLIEIPLSIWSLGAQHYNPFSSVPHAPLHFFDAAIIVTTFVLEVVLRGKERELAELLIILRLWRLIKLVGGVAVGAGEIEDDTVKELAELKEELVATRSALSSAQEENQALRSRIAALQPTNDDGAASP
ncbi:hypothetical protein OF83DRAFT_1071155 [Amylostereum chailletii]|nr:hypothetical protein OF83DRAFT_1071155 [Amylostereum chailletii]